ncbi:lytic transglycosylase domain-containing protein [Novosphingobium sp. KN65.2]|uniref:lytic transglycosylase domain-containing protein n=1 Tax=Novosphingobium sp. KN65.2 TaxID=1478134 RepID=UPI0005E82D65|nr:lytic transglycosylase domain-containing protein [Novosphingobium sp. KN65.2]CDO37992.1 Conjugal transfer protein [Novosphingobium sp. KN65.2]
MIYTVAALSALAQRCAPDVASEALVPLVVAESGGDPLRINVNKGPRVRAKSLAEATGLVRRYVTAGYSVDIGLAQINSRNLARLGVSIEETFDPCTNLALASSVLQEGYAKASQFYSGLDAISVTYSLYNTGSMTRGFDNGYVRRVWSAAAMIGAIKAHPALAGPSLTGPSPLPSIETQAASAPAAQQPEQWVFGQVNSSIEVFQ